MNSEKKKIDSNKVSSTVADEKYFLEGEDDDALAKRVGYFMGAAEFSIDKMRKYGKLFYELIRDKKFIPGGRILANAGTYFEEMNVTQITYLSDFDFFKSRKADNQRCGQMLNCYVIPVEDSKHGQASIYESIEDAADITAMEGGVGENFSKIRPRGDPIRGNLKYKSSGPLSFLKIFNESSKQLRQGGGRRGANMAVLNCDHPDIVDFIKLKSDEKTVTEFNISVGIYDEFVEAALANKDWDLKFNGKVYRTVNARYLLDLFIKHSWEKVSKGGGGGEPGFLFLDTAAKTWAFPGVKPITTNPCGEQFLDFYEACDLGAMNLYAYVKYNDHSGLPFFDIDQFRLDIAIAIRFLDNVLDLNNYPLRYRGDVSRKISMDNRRIGLGIMGLADTLMSLNQKYQAGSYIENIMENFAEAAHQASVNLGSEKGRFLAYEKSSERFKNRRNCCVTTIAPTGTTSMWANVWGGCEPFFGLVTKKKTTDGTGYEYYIVPDSFKKLMKSHKIELTDDRLKEIYNNRGSVSGLKWVPESLQEICKTTMDIKWQQHVEVQCLLQKYIENSISKTINLPKEAPMEDAFDAFISLWKGGAKGGTIYRDGTRDLQIMNVGDSSSSKDDKVVIKVENKIIHKNDGTFVRSDILNGKTHKVKTKTFNTFENIYITINEDNLGRPMEVFIHNSTEADNAEYLSELIGNGVAPELAQKITDKISRMHKDNVNSVTRLISTNLRNGVDLRDLVKQLNKINPFDIHNIYKKLAKILSSYIEDGTESEEKCEKCDGKLIYQESCLRCISCGNSKCG